MARYDSIIFDLDGTLWNASEACARGWNAALESRGVQDIVVSPQDMKDVSGRPFFECVRMLVPYAMAGADGELFEAINSHEKVTVERDGGIAFDGVVDGTRALAGRYPLFLVSNCQDWYLDAFWEHIQVKRFFRDSDCHGSSGVSKAEMIRNLVAKHDLQSSIYIGDTEGDEQASDSAAVDFGFAEYGFGKARDPRIRFDSFDAIVDWFGK